jgi:prolipoprotein diacylglyceryltransferase
VSLAAIPSPSVNDLQLGPFTVHVYGLMYAVAVMAAIGTTRRRWRREGGSDDLVYEVALWGFPAGLIGGRLYFLVTSWDQAAHTWWGPFAAWDGGLGIWDGILAGTLAGLWVLRRRGADIARFLDAAAPALLVAQSSAASATTSTRNCSASSQLSASMRRSSLAATAASGETKQ